MGAPVPPAAPLAAIGNPFHEKDIEYVMKFNYWILVPLGIWPIGHHKLDNLVSNTGIIIAVVNRREGIKTCLEYVKRDWQAVESEADRALMLKYARVGRQLITYCTAFMGSGGLIYHTILPFVVKRANERQNDTIKPLVYPVYEGFYDSQRSPVYELVFFAHFLCGYVSHALACGVCGIAALFASHACGQIDVLISRLEQLVEQQSDDISIQIALLVQKHLSVLKFSAIVEEILREVCLVEFVGSTFMICLLEYYCLVDWEANERFGFTTYILLLISLSFNIFMLCYIGELLTEKTSSVGKVCYSIDWHLLPSRRARDLMLIIAMSRNPAKLTAGRMIDLTITTFGNTLKTSFGYLNFLRTAFM
ncbi:hypothetical protein KM043_005910 [Ampulex compressa]|nr:hypothetical protein KM043_005910 [Ampulex compressa]